MRTTFISAFMFLGFTLVTATGCDHLQPPTVDECRVAVDRVVQLHAQADVDPSRHPIMSWAANKAYQAVTDVSGDKEDMVRQCLSDMNRAEVRCLISARTMDEAKKCR